MVVIKASVESIEADFRQDRGGIALLTDPHGVIFISNRVDWRYHALWEISPEELSQIAETKQFGKGPWSWTGLTMEDENRAVDESGNEYLIYRTKFANYPGWNANYLVRLETIHRSVLSPMITTSGYIVLALCLLVGISALLLYRIASQDIVRRKKAEESLRESEATLKSIFRAAPTGIGMVCDRVITQVNERFCELLGYSKEELIDNSARMLYPNQEEFEWVGREKYAQISERGTGTVETRWQRKDGSIIDVLLSSTPLDPSDLLQGVTFTALDITDRKQAEEASRASEERYRSIYNTAPLAFVVWDYHCRITDWNKCAKKMFGWSREEVLGRNFFKFLIPEGARPKVEAVVDLLLRKELPSHSINENLTKSGEIVLCEWNNSVRYDSEGHVVGAISLGLDITDRKQAEEERQRLEVQLQRAQKMEAIGTLAGGVAHDLNNILSGLVSYPELLLMDIADDSPLRKPIQTIQKSGQKAAAIVQDLLTLARRGVTTSEVMNLNDIISDFLRSPECNKLQEYHLDIRFEVNCSPDLLNIRGAPVHLSKTLMNLISNAAEAMVDGGKISIFTANQYIDRPIRGYDDVLEGDYAVLTVSDSGVGISPEDLERIFEPFYTNKVMGRSGTGLGMAVVWGAVKDHKGYIDVQSTAGRGTRFVLYFPATREKLAEKGITVPIDEYMGNETILVVDDVEDQREIAYQMLTKLGYFVTAVSSGEEAIEYMKDSSADLMVLDMIMDPGIDGLDTYKKILKYHQGQKAIIASGFSETERVKEAQKLGAGAYIKKPYILEQIGVAVRTELDK